MELKGLAKKVFEDRYQYGDATIDKMWSRLAWTVANVEDNVELRNLYAKAFYELLLKDFNFVPGGRILASAGVNAKVPLFNCYVGDIMYDSTESIYANLKADGHIMRHGGGVGRNFSVLRPKDTPVRGTKGKSSGVVAWANLFSENANTIRQGGSRRGALLGLLEVWHPDIIDFIEAKAKDPHILQYMNLSVGITDAFMEAVKNDYSWDLIFPDTTYSKYDAEWTGDIDAWCKKGYPVKVYNTVKARDIWDLICKSAWSSGEPGVIFLERYNKKYPLRYYNKIVSTNPCGELGLPYNGVCNLGSINLSAHVKDGEIDYEKLEKTISLAVRFLDNVIDLSPYLTEQHYMEAKNTRRIGLGTMGLADMLIKLGVKYGSPESLLVIDKLYRFIRDKAYEASIYLAKERGPFPVFDADKYTAVLQQEYDIPARIIEEIKKYGIRNGTLLTLAPTGSTSILAGVSSGIEPVFAWKYTRRDQLGKHEVVHPLVEELGLDINNLPEYCVTAKEISPEDHVNVQAVIQKYIDNSISKTINAPAYHTVEDVKRVFWLAYEKGCKGLTYFREGCNREGVLQDGNSRNDVNNVPNTNVHVNAANTLPVFRRIDAPIKEAIGKRYKLQTGCGSLWLHVYEDDTGRVKETFVTTSNGGCNSTSVALSRMISLALRGGIDVTDVIDQLESSPPCVSYCTARAKGHDVAKGASCPSAIGKVLASYQRNTTARKEVARETAVTTDRGECTHPNMRHESGCLVCPDCGYSKCD